MAPQVRRRTLLLAGGAAALAVPAAAFTAGPIMAAAAPQTLTGPVSGQLASNSGGAFALYQFNYPGDGSAVTLTLTTNISAPLDSGAAGVNIYQNGNLMTSASRSGPFTATAIYSSSTSGPLVVQVFNYDPVNSISYTLTPQGLPTQSSSSTSTTSATTTTATAASATTPTTSSSSSSSTSMSGTPQALTGPVSGRLVGNSGGAFALYQFNYRGDGSAVMLTLTTDTATPLASGAAGINIYQNGARVTTSSQSGPFQVTAVYSSSTGGPVVVQVFNYDPANPISYTLTPQGLTP